MRVPALAAALIAGKPHADGIVRGWFDGASGAEKMSAPSNFQAAADRSTERTS